jgi:hypothetical protein
MYVACFFFFSIVFFYSYIILNIWKFFMMDRFDERTCWILSIDEVYNWNTPEELTRPSN